MHFNLKDPKAQTGLSDLVETLERISITDFTAPIAHGSADHTLRFLAESPETLDELARGWAALGADFPTVLLVPIRAVHVGSGRFVPDSDRRMRPVEIRASQRSPAASRVRFAVGCAAALDPAGLLWGIAPAGDGQRDASGGGSELRIIRDDFTPQSESEQSSSPA